MQTVLIDTDIAIDYLRGREYARDLLFSLWERSGGITLTSLDCMINATASIKNHKIATNNTDHYPNKDILLQF